MQNVKKITVKVPAGESFNYDIAIGSNILSGVWADIEKKLPGLKRFVITDSNLVAAGHLTGLITNHKTQMYIIDPPGEESKNISTVVEIVNAMEQAFFGRDTCVIGIGGGTVGDIAGFAAAIFKRGVCVVHIPTTTVAQADSAIGGKTGVDSAISKNAFGAFHHPRAVYIDVELLKTLDEQQYNAGLVESVKHALIADSRYFEMIEKNIDAILARDTQILEQLAAYNCKIKAEVVQVDPVEKNRRRILNYGHTIGHAVETASRYRILHGQAVAIGIIAAGLIEIKLGIGSMERLQRIKAMFKKLNQPVSIPAGYAAEALLEIIKRDKKAVDAWPRFVLIDAIGTIHTQNGQYAVEVPQQAVKEVLAEMCER